MKLTRILSTLIAAALATLSNTATAATGDLDTTFGGTGKVTTAIGSSDDYANSVAVLTDGTIIVAGTSWNGNNFDFALSRYNADGSLDTSFNGTGKVTTALGSGDDRCRSVVVQGDGKIVVAGDSRVGSGDAIALARYNANGTLDTSFNGIGKVTTAFAGGSSYAWTVAVQSDLKIVVAGDSNNGGEFVFALVRYIADGSLDTGFGVGGKVTTDIGNGGDYGRSMTLQNDGKILVAGSSVIDSINKVAVVRYNANGSLDTTFNGTGKVTTLVGTVGNIAYAVTVQADGKIVVAGESYNATNADFLLLRYNSNGSLDTSFNGTGKVITDFGLGGDSGRGVAVQRDGKIVVAGYSWNADNEFDFALARYRANGVLDTSFNGDGKAITDFSGAGDIGNGLVVNTDGQILMAGYAWNGNNFDFAVARYEGDLDTDGDGISDQYETGTGIYVSPTDTGTSPTNPDIDGDGLSDGAEVNIYASNPNVRDTDADGFDDGFEVSTGFSPTSAASTPDALSSIRPACGISLQRGERNQLPDRSLNRSRELVHVGNKHHRQRRDHHPVVFHRGSAKALFPLPAELSKGSALAPID